VGWKLQNAEEQNRAHPRSFFIPPNEERTSLKPGQLAKLVFLTDDSANARGERMWVLVQAVTPVGYVGKLDNDPIQIKELSAGDEIQFGPHHVAALWSDVPPGFPADKKAVANRRIVQEDLEPKVLIYEEPTSTNDSGWTFLLGTETPQDMNDREMFLGPNLGWLVERYPALLPVVTNPKRGVHVYDEAKRQYRFDGLPQD
jgi:hypothetical protein